MAAATTSGTFKSGVHGSLLLVLLYTSSTRMTDHFLLLFVLTICKRFNKRQCPGPRIIDPHLVQRLGGLTNSDGLS